MRRLSISAALLVAIATTTYSAEEVKSTQATAPKATTEAPQKASESTKKMTTISDLNSYLEASFKANKLESKGTIAYCTNTKSLYAIAKPIISADPISQNARDAFVACSLSTERSVAVFNNKRKMLDIISLQDSIIESLNERIAKMASLYESEKSKLKADLDDERAKAKKLRDEADKKFSELQSSLIQVSNDARGTIISMSDILFAVGKADLTPDLKTSLAKISGILMVFKTSNVIVEGHTDNSGSEEFNMTLSQKRAENVMNFMVEQGVAASRLTAKGYGLTKPIAENDTPEGRAKNRRVDLVIQDKKSD